MSVRNIFPQVDPVHRTYLRRIGAVMVDWVLLVEFPIWLRDDVLETTQSTRFAAWFVCLLVLSLIYPVVGYKIWGQTVGKWLFGVQVRDLSGGPISWRQAIARESYTVATTIERMLFGLGPLVSGVSDWEEQGPLSAAALRGIEFGWYFLAGAAMFLSTRRRAVHDLIAGTVVVRVPSCRGVGRMSTPLARMPD